MRYSKLLLSAITLFILLHTATAQTNKYDSLWKKVTLLAGEKGLPQSALAEVNKIYALAKKEKQEAQAIKALVYRLTLEETNTEKAAQEITTQLEKEAVIATEPSRSILYSVLAEVYWNYFQQNRWKFYNRTATVNFKKEDITTWSANDFHSTIGALYLASLKEERLLQQTDLTAYDPIIIKGNTRHLRPTLYDLLANRALDYFENSERDISRPAYAFEINQPEAFLPAAQFAGSTFTTKDTGALHFKALQLYQSLIRFHAKDANPSPLTDLDIRRLGFVNRHAVMENKDSLYLNALEVLAGSYPTSSAAAQAWYLIARWHADKAENYKPLKDTSYRYEYITAKKICEAIVAQKDSSEGKANCFNLLRDIKERTLTLATEKVNLPLQPFRVLVNYRNFSKGYFRIIRATDDLKKQLHDRYSDPYWKLLTGLTSIHSWSQTFPFSDDFQEHNAEIKVDALPAGNYILLASANENFSLDKNPLAVQYFYVSAISYINNDNDYFILHRETGKPLAGATVQTWWSGYDYSSRQYKIDKGQKYTADKNGYLQLQNNKKDRLNNVRLELIYKQDRLFLDDEQYIYYRSEYTAEKNYEKDNSQVFFFTDRSIYRPGQTVYFKGIAITKDVQTKKSKIISGYKAKLYLYNANNEEVDSLELTTNEFGSYSGKFHLPENMLNGTFRIKEDDIRGEANFSVEEYKRPKFYVEYESLKGTYKVNDSVTVIGLAKAYAGNNVDGAQVKYRVVREARFIYPWLYWGRGYPQSDNLEGTNDTTSTDAGGKFTIRFKAIPDLTISRQLDPVFDYKVIADITDINGETRSGTTIVPVSYKALVLKIGSRFGETIPVDSFKNISITTTNLNGTFEPAVVKLTISPLQSEGRLIRKRYWEQPDQHVMSKEEYIQSFPHDEYADETDYHSWNKGEKIIERTDSSSSNSSFSIPPSSFAEGWYQAEAVTKDKYGQAVKDIFYFRLYNPRSSSLPSSLYIWSDQKNNFIEPGDSAAITIGSSAGDLFLIQQVNKQKADKPTYNFIKFTKKKKDLYFRAKEDDRGGFSVTHFFIKDNRFYSVMDHVSVPWTNKELTISYETYRDKTLPGSEEKWKLKIGGYRKEKVASEMLASMYDASLDQYKMHMWNTPYVWPSYYSYSNWSNNSNFQQATSDEREERDTTISFYKKYDHLIFYDPVPVSNPLLALEGRVPGLFITQANGLPGAAAKVQIRGQSSLLDGTVAKGYYSTTQRLSTGNVTTVKAKMLVIVDGVPVELDKEDYSQYADITILKDADATAIYGSRGANGVVIINTKGGKKNPAEETKIRKNFNETAFFFPDLKTDAAGNIEFSFTMPEALTRWKFQALAHTKELAFGYSTKDIVTQKDLMVQPNAPRFLREGDKMELNAKVVNMSDKNITGTVQLQLLDAVTLHPVDSLFHNLNPSKSFILEAGKSIPANFSIEIPYQYNSAVVYRFIAKGNNISDGEEAALPVLTNRMLVTESMPLPMRGNTTKSFRFEKLLQSANSQTLQQHALTVEYTSNPAWYAVQALPYLMEYPYECAEQTFNRFYANALATHIANAVPKLKAVFEKWKTTDTAALLSNLQKNQELKSVLLEETPWVLQAKTEAQQKKNIALLFDMLRMQTAFTASLDKLLQSQTSNGGFSWFKGGPDDRYITQYIVSGIGHLQKMEAMPADVKEKVKTILDNAIPYLDSRLKEDYEQLLKWKTKLTDNNLGYTQIQYLYMRSFFPPYAIANDAQTAVNYYREQARQYWLKQNKYMQGMIALSLHRNGDEQTPAAILASLKENAIVNDEMGMYWKQNSGGYYWQEAPVETQSLLIEAFGEISKDGKVVDDLKTWLLKQKQAQSWSTTKATADACYALLLQGGNWLSADQAVEVTVEDTKIVSTEVNAESGTGYFKTTFDGASVKPSMGNISVKVSSSATNTLPSWGAVYWQYFENLDKITTAATPLQLNKKLFVEKNTDNGPVLQPVSEGDQLKVGDKIKVRIELRVDRDMEYVHMKDMRAACMEPVNVLSSYKWQDGLGYYESTKDASTNFFFSRLPKGTYVFEYPLFVTARGDFSNGISSIQCMYAPEFSSHSEGVRVHVN